jgi:hypothetical protein
MNYKSKTLKKKKMITATSYGLVRETADVGTVVNEKLAVKLPTPWGRGCNHAHAHTH